MPNNNSIHDIKCQNCIARHKSVFKRLNMEELEYLDDVKGCRFYKKNQILFNEGSHSNGVYCLNDGKVKIYKIAHNGSEQILGFAKSGDIVGYRALLADEPYTTSAAVIAESMVCFLPRTSIQEMMQKNPSLGMKFMGLLCHNLKTSHNRMIDMSHKTVKERLAQTLLLLKETFGFEEDGETLNIKLTRKELANYVGTASESIIRLLYEFKENGLIELNGQKIIFKDKSALVDRTGVYH